MYLGGCIFLLCSVPRKRQFKKVVLVGKAMIIMRSVFPAGARSTPAGPKIVLVPPRSILYIYICPHLKIIMPFIHVVLEECTP